MEILKQTDLFEAPVIISLRIRSGVMLLANLISTPSFDPYRHCEVATRCIFLMIGLYLAPSDYMVILFSTLQNAFYIGTEIDGIAAQLIYSLASLAPWFFAAIFPNEFQIPLPQHSELIMVICCLVVLLSYIVSTATVSKRTRLSALTKLEQAYVELRELNSKNEEMNKVLKELLEDKDNFILLFSHETRNPLNILIGNLTLLLNEVETPSLRTKLLRAKFCGELLLHHLNNILDTGKLTNKNVLEISPVNLKTSEYIQSMWDFMEMMVRKKNLRPDLYVSRSIPRFLMLDPQRLSQILLNLISNAAKFTTVGSVSLIVSYLNQDKLEESDFYPTSVFGHKLSSTNDQELLDSEIDLDEFSMETKNLYLHEFKRELFPEDKTSFENIFLQQSKGYLKFEINDTGCGIKVEDLEKLFKKFTQVHSDGTRRQIGSGLGLWISKNLAQMMGGDIRVFSKINVGTTFVVIVRAETPPEIRRSRKESFQTSSPSRRGEISRKILLADDDLYNIDVHKQLLMNAGYDDITIAKNGKELVELFEAHPEERYYAVITDVQMPEVDGIAAAKMIREIEKERGVCRGVKIGFITGHANHSDKTIVEQDPINAWFYVSKPVTTTILERYLEKRKTSHRKKGTEEELAIQCKTPMVLCVDDDLFNLEVLEEMLSGFGVKPLRAQSGPDAIEVVKSRIEENKAVDLILMDSHMPGMDGWTASQKIKELLEQKGKSLISIVGVSGDKQLGNEEKLKRAGIQHWIQKPVQREDLLGTLKKFIVNFGSKSPV